MVCFSHLEFVVFGKAVFVDAVVFETGFFEHTRNLIKVVGDVLGLVSIGAYGNDLSAEFTVALESSHAGMEFLHSLAHCLGVDLDSFFVFDKISEDLVNDISVFGVVIFADSARHVPDDVIEMAEYVKVVEFLYILKIFGEILPEYFLLIPSFKELSVVRVFAVDKVEGTDYEIIFMVSAEDEVFFYTAFLKTDLHTEFDADLIPVFLTQAEKFIQI